MAMTKDGKHKSSKFRANRADREKEKTLEPKMHEPGQRAEAHEMEKGEPEEEGMERETPTEEAGEEMVHPDIHEEIKQIAAEHGPAHTVNMAHDHEHMKSHVHSVHMDGHEHHAQHDGEQHVIQAHHHAMHAAGMTPPEEPKEEGQEGGMASMMGGEGEEPGYGGEM
jgi:hypothetical protein